MYIATQKLKEHNINILPVMKEDKLVGVITDRDLKEELQKNLKVLYMVDLRENRREIYG